MTLICPICDLHRDIDQQKKYEIYRDDLWVLRHHPAPAPVSYTHLTLPTKA